MINLRREYGEVFKCLLGQPAIIAGLVVLFGLIALKRPITEIIKGTIRAILGFLILMAGTTLIVGTLSNFGKLFESAFKMQGIIPSNEAAISVILAQYGSVATFIFVAGLILNIILARLTKYKYIFLASDHAFYMACAITPIMVLAGFNTVEAIIFGSLLLGVILCVMPALAHPTMKLITGNDNVSFAHFGTWGYWFSAQIGKMFRKNSKSIEDIEFPKALAFLQDSNVSVSLVMAILFFIVTLISGSDVISKLTDMNPYVWALLQAIEFSAGIVVLLAGVNMLLEEIMPAFKGFSNRIVPNAIPAYPFAILFKGTSNALLAGFLSSLLGGILGMLVQIFIGTVVILPGIVFHFFCGGLSAIFGNATGGRKGALLGPFINGIIMTFLPIVFIQLFGKFGFLTTSFSDSDFLFVDVVLGSIIASTNKVVLMAVILIIFILPFLITLVTKNDKSSEAKNSIK